MKKTVFTGSAVAIVTPMKADFSIDFDALGQLIEYQLSNSTDAIVICGTTGEVSCLSDEEHIQAIAYTVDKVAKRVPVIAGTGSNYTAHGIELSKKAEKVGADALLHVTPYYNKATQNGLYEHFAACAAAVSLPIILYNVPSRTGVNIGLDTFKRLSKIENIVAVKEASGNITQVADIAAACGDVLDIYSGNDDQIVPLLSLGGKGVISVLANVAPKQTHNICQLYFEGKTAESCALQLEMLPLIHALFCEVNPIPVKQAVNFMGFEAGHCRLPLCDMEAANAAKLKEQMQQIGLIK